MKEMVLGDLGMFTELETFLLETSGTFRWRWSIGNQKICRTHREIPKKIEPLADDDAKLCQVFAQIAQIAQIAGNIRDLHGHIDDTQNYGALECGQCGVVILAVVPMWNHTAVVSTHD
jgi:hypothetical protein